MVSIDALLEGCQTRGATKTGESELCSAGEPNLLERLERLWLAGSSCLVLLRRGDWGASEPAPFARGTIELLGEKGDVKAESDGALQQQGLQHRDFSPQVYRQLQGELSAKCPRSHQPLWLVEALEDPTRLDCRRPCAKDFSQSEAKHPEAAESPQLAEHDLSFFVLHSLKADAHSHEKERQRRLPLRIFTIDPPDARDLDDALSISVFPPEEVKETGASAAGSRNDSPINFEFEVGVHVADVSFFVKEGSALDAEAMDRATSVYLDSRCVCLVSVAKAKYVPFSARRFRGALGVCVWCQGVPDVASRIKRRRLLPSPTVSASVPVCLLSRDERRRLPNARADQESYLHGVRPSHRL